MSINSKADKPVVVAYIREILVPLLQPGPVVILNKQGGRGVDAKRAGCRLLLLQLYSRELNSMGQAWSKLKVLLRSRQHEPNKHLRKR